MGVKKKYAEVVKEVEAENYEIALKLLYKMRSHEKDFYYIEAGIFHSLKNQLKEYLSLKKLLPLMPRSSPEDKKDYETALQQISVCCSQLGLVDECLKLQRRVINTTKDIATFRDVISYSCFIINAKEDTSVADFQDLYKKYRSSFKFTPFPRKFYEHDKIRVGFLSGDFYNHVVMKWSCRLITELDKNLFETYCYSSNKMKDQITKRLISKIDSWQEIYDLTDEEAAKLIQDDEIDILFDLSGHTGYNRLGVMAYRPATVQISGIGFSSSTGLKTVDYFLTDEYCVGNSAPYFTENLIAMSHSHVCYTLFSEVETKRATEPPCLKNGYVTFGCFNQYRKITDSILITWKKILDAVPNSRLLLKNHIIKLDGGKEFVSKRLKRFGIDLKRVELRGFSEEHPLDYNDMDIALDTFPYTGVTTTTEALLMGVPVISLYGDRHATRCGLSILNNVGLNELAVDSYDEYVKRAVLLAGDWDLIAILKKNLQTMFEKSPLMDYASYIKEIEQAFIEVLNAERNRQ
ncbi:MAG: hypothetical protein SR1Q5_00430 [Quinella sp. 1Q5]|nr:hypothetical protein [Quinella sp. 1Q5]